MAECWSCGTKGYIEGIMIPCPFCERGKALAGKTSKKVAGYRWATDAKTCRVCDFMNMDGTCDRVEGIVSPSWTCHLWGPCATK